MSLIQRYRSDVLFVGAANIGAPFCQVYSISDPLVATGSTTSAKLKALLDEKRTS